MMMMMIYTHTMIWINLNTGGGDDRDGRPRSPCAVGSPAAVAAGGRLNTRARVHAIHGSPAMVTV
jgi:hypothetical protein